LILGLKWCRKFGRRKREGEGEAKVLLTAICLVPFHRIPPPKESMKAFLENRRLKRAYPFCWNPPEFLSNKPPACGNSK
jgi:hypothetical protein